MNALPSGVEAALLEAGFSGTEIVILQRLLEKESLTLRELASRTGKSTGVLDLAAKKLLQKGIVKKENVNDSAKLTITTFDAVLRWMEEDEKRKRSLAARRHQNFETFIRSLEEDKKKPAIEYFDGLEGLACAYRKLLDCGKELLCYVPVFCTIEDDPLRDFKVEWFRMRRKKGIFSRVIAHNTPLGRRFQSRDPFEYRRTILVEESVYPFTFEKIICGNTVACINYTEKRACLLRYGELASMETSFFESLWSQLTVKQEVTKSPTGVLVPSSPPPPPPHPGEVPLSVRTLSSLREFFLSRTSIAAFAVIAVLSAAITFGLYSYTKKLQFERMQEAVMSIAATGALQFEAKDLDALRVESDWRKPEWEKVVRRLEAIRRQNDDVIFVYLLRSMRNDPNKIEFIADSHSLNPYANLDDDPTNDIDVGANRDGKIEPYGQDKLQWPGQPYPDVPPDALLGFQNPVASTEPYTDIWGTLISGYAPVKNNSGEVVGILAVDMEAKLLTDRTGAIIQPILYFFGLFLFFVFVRLAAFNRSLFLELWKGLQMQKVLIVLTSCSLIAFFITFGLYRYVLRLTMNEVGSKLTLIVTTVAPEINPKDLDQLHTREDMKTEVYQRVFKKINQVRDADTDINIKFIYTYRPMGDGNDLEFIVDADSNYYLPDFGPDFNKDGKIDELDTNVAPGFKVPDPEEAMFEGLEKPVYSMNFYSTQWGTLISGYAPIKDTNIPAAIGADVDVSDVYKILHNKFIPWLWFMGTIAGSLLLFLIFTWIRPRQL